MSVNFSITFLAPFAVSTGRASDGRDNTVEQGNPLPSTAIKGLMRAQAAHGLRLPRTVVEQVFGSARHPSPWAWSNAVVTVEVGLWTRIRVDEQGRAEERDMRTGDIAFANRGTFSVTWQGAGDPPPEHVLALRASGRHVVSLGGHRRRGQGWVRIIDDEPWTADDSRRLLALTKRTEVAR